MIERIFGHWKSSSVGLVAAVFLGFVLYSPQYFHPIIVDFAKFVAVGGAAAIGLNAKDPGRP